MSDVRAMHFYSTLFGWSAEPHVFGSGAFHSLSLRSRQFASLYQLPRALIERGVASHWLPYVATSNLRQTLEKAGALGAKALTPELAFAGFARIAVIQDPTGALVGLWQRESRGLSDSDFASMNGAGPHEGRSQS